MRIVLQACGQLLLSSSIVLLLAATSTARADDLECVSTTFNLLSPNDKVCVSDFDDPKVPGVTCYISQARKGGWGQPFGLNEDPSNFSVSCRQMGPIAVDISTLPEREEAFSEEDQHLLQEDAYLPDYRREAQYADLSRHQHEDRGRFAGQCDQRRADHAMGGKAVMSALLGGLGDGLDAGEMFLGL